MKYGFVKAAAATPKIRVADVHYNGGNIIQLIGRAEKAGAELLVFPELCVCGYTCGDLFGQNVLLDGCLAALSDIAAATKGKSMLVFVGVPYKGENTRVELNGEQIPFGNKILFRESNHPDFTVAAELCEDLWVPAPPSVSHALAGANIIVNLSASDETAGARSRQKPSPAMSMRTRGKGSLRRTWCSRGTT